MAASPHKSPDYLTGVEVAAMFEVHPKTVARWARAGRLAFFLTPGGRRRYYATPIREKFAILRKGPTR